MIKTFKHKGLKTFFETGNKSGIQPHHASRLARQLIRLDIAENANAMNVPGCKFHPLNWWPCRTFSVTVNGNWRMTFAFEDEDEDAMSVDYQNYH